MVAGLSLSLGGRLAAQAKSGPPVTIITAETRTVAATPAPVPPVIDGRDDDAIWQTVPILTGFRTYKPVEDGTPAFRTEARVAYDAENLYVFVRAYDPHPDSIVALLARRDAMTPSDIISVLIDGYHDRRTGYEFDVNPAGVKIDQAIYQDGNEDPAWDGIWDVATRIDSLGWTAEFRFPFSQIRHAAQPSDTFGFSVARTVERTSEQSSWPLFRPSRPGVASQLGTLTALDHLAPPRRAELAPYVVTKNVSVPSASGYGREQQVSIGGDVKLALGPNLTLTGTVNPDFGQVEADPAVLNLGAFETFFPEHRPFFVEGNGLFQFNVDCSAVNCSNEQIFYSRRIGRSPQLGGLYPDPNAPTATRIDGAAKLTGQLPGGWSLGVIDAVTAREAGAGNATIEPTTNYGVLRATKDFRAGASGLGLIVTAVDRSTDIWTSPYLPRSAYVGAFEFRHQFLGRRYQIDGSLDWSRVNGSPAAITALQRNPVHYYQRPDGPLHVDSTATALTGDAEELRIGKISGEHLHFETSYLRRSPGFEVNDLGFMFQADQQSWNNWIGLSWRKPTRAYLRINWNFNWWQWWTAAGLPTERAANTNFHTQLTNRWYVNAGATLGQLGTTWCDRCARGGPAVRQDPAFNPWINISGDDRHKVIPSVNASHFTTSGGRDQNWNVGAQVTLNASTRLTASLGVSYDAMTARDQWYGRYADSAGTHYTFAQLDQKTFYLTADLGYTVTPELTVQWYLQPFVSRGPYSDIRELADPGAARFDDRYKAYGDTAVTLHPGGVDSKQFNSNLVVRWEYRPGSTLFVVWTQQRSDFQPFVGPEGLGRDFRGIFDLHQDNTFLVKLSYWFNR